MSMQLWCRFSQRFGQSMQQQMKLWFFLVSLGIEGWFVMLLRFIVLKFLFSFIGLLMKQLLFFWLLLFWQCVIWCSFGCMSVQWQYLEQFLQSSFQLMVMLYLMCEVVCSLFSRNLEMFGVFVNCFGSVCCGLRLMKVKLFQFDEVMGRRLSLQCLLGLFVILCRSGVLISVLLSLQVQVWQGYWMFVVCVEFCIRCVFW